MVSPVFFPLKIVGEYGARAARCMFLCASLAGFPFAHALTELRTAAHESTEPKFVSISESGAKAGRGRFIFHRNPGITGEIRRAGFGDKVKILPTVMHATKLYMLVGKHLPKATVSKMQSALTQLEKKGELVRLLDKWKEE